MEVWWSLIWQEGKEGCDKQHERKHRERERVEKESRCKNNKFNSFVNNKKERQPQQRSSHMALKTAYRSSSPRSAWSLYKHERYYSTGSLWRRKESLGKTEDEENCRTEQTADDEKGQRIQRQGERGGFIVHIQSHNSQMLLEIA